MTDAERQLALDQWVTYYARQGYLVRWRDRFSAQVEGPKHFSVLLAVILFLLMILPFVLYLVYYLGSRGHMVTIEVTEAGQILTKGPRC